MALDNVRSAHNVGSIFRTSDGAGVDKIYLVGYTPAPVDRFGRAQPEIVKTSLGASDTVAWEQLNSEAARAELARLKEDGWQIVAIEQTAHSISLHEFTATDKVVYIFGNEIDGVSKELLSLADAVVEIPMHGQKESLNVSVSVGIILFQK